MIDDAMTACSNCSCPLNYDCERFKLFFEGKYIFSEEFMHNGDYSCMHKPSEEDQEIETMQGSFLF
jgi:hypothetical protein